MIIRINSIESTIEVFHEQYLHLHGFLKLSAEDKKNYKEWWSEIWNNIIQKIWQRPRLRGWKDSFSATGCSCS